MHQDREHLDEPGWHLVMWKSRGRQDPRPEAGNTFRSTPKYEIVMVFCRPSKRPESSQVLVFAEHIWPVPQTADPHLHGYAKVDAETLLTEQFFKWQASAHVPGEVLQLYPGSWAFHIPSPLQSQKPDVLVGMVSLHFLRRWGCCWPQGEQSLV